jgi:hypothetical protein
MHNTRFVRRGQSICYLDSDIDDVAYFQRRSTLFATITSRRRQRPAEALPKCFTVNELAGNEVSSADLSDFVDDDEQRAPRACSCSVPKRASCWYPHCGCACFASFNHAVLISL